MTTALGEPPSVAVDGPYVGPRPFDTGERALFFGRTQEAQALASLIVAHRVVLLYAASGAGKTSLLNAGVVPLLAEEDSFEVLPPARLLGLARADDRENPWIANLLANLAPGTPPTGTLAQFLAARPVALGEDELPAPRALIIDQFEELFTLYPGRWPERRDVFLQIADALAADPLLRVVLALREDYVAQLDPFADLLPGRLRTRMRLESLRRDAALEAVKGPLLPERRTFAPGVAERLVDDLLRVRVHTRGDEPEAELLGETVEPVQLQVVCRTLWASLPPETEVIGEAELERIGTVADVLSGYYQEAVHAAAAAGAIGEPELRERLEAAFITPVGTRGTVIGGEARTAGMPNAAIAELEARHLVRAEWRAGARWFELTHDSLIGPIVASNTALRRHREARRVRRLQRAIAALVVVALALVGAVLLLTREEPAPVRPRQTVAVLSATGPFATLQLKHTLRGSAAPVGLRFLAGGRGLALASADGRIRVWDMNLGREVDTLDYGHNGVSSLDVDAGGSQMLVTGPQGLKSWNARGLGSRAPDRVRVGGSDTGSTERRAPTAAAFGGRGNWLVTVRDGQAELAFRYGSPESSQPPFSRRVARVASSASGATMAGVTAEGGVIVRDVVDGDFGVQPAGPERVLPARSAIVAASFAADGAEVVTASRDGAARLWRTSDGALLKTLRGDGAALADAQLSSDGQYVATAAQNGLVRVFSAAGRRLAVIRASTRPVEMVGFAAAGRLLVTADSDGVARVWTVTARANPLNIANCGGYYGPGASRGSVVCLTTRGATLRAPEAGVVRPVHGAGVSLTTPDGRVWRFRSARAVQAGATAAAGAPIATALSSLVGVELWQDARGARRLLSRWNPLLFLPETAATRAQTYPGDNASQEATAHWMGNVAKAAGLPPELPVMAGLVESGLKNLNFGDRDSVGFFGMRTGVWNQGPYEGFPERPELQMRWFTDVALAVRRQQIAAGRDPAADPSRYGEWVADIEQPPTQYRGRFQLRLQEARTLLGRAGPAPPADAMAAPGAAAAAPSVEPGATPCKPCPAGAAGKAADAALGQRGRPFRPGGSSPEAGFDSDGLVRWAYQHAGVSVPPYAAAQASAGKPVPQAALERGDIVLFVNREGDISHVGLYLDDGRFVHVPANGVVTVDSLDQAPWAQRFSAGRRIA